MYLDYMIFMVNLRKYIWKLKVSLKITIFMSFLHRKVIWKKNNLSWQIGT
jgi:hypothetical protein